MNHTLWSVTAINPDYQQRYTVRTCDSWAEADAVVSALHQHRPDLLDVRVETQALLDPWLAIDWQ